MTGGTGADTLDGGLGIDTINGLAGNDTLIGASTDGSQDSLFAGDGTDTCQGPAPDPDIHNSCEITATPPVTGAGSSRANATELCQAAGGTFVDLGPLAYNCVFVNAFSNHRVAEAGQVCTDLTGTFANATLIYSCVLP